MQKQVPDSDYKANNLNSALYSKSPIMMTWSLIEEDKEYFASYAKKGDKPWILNQIKHALIKKSKSLNNGFG